MDFFVDADETAGETGGVDGTDGDFLSREVKRFFGLDYLFPYQRLVISNILEAFDALKQGDSGQTDRAALGRQIVILPTGAGKSLCFQLPAMLLEGATLVLYPILSLMADQEKRLRSRGFTPALLRGGQSEDERDGIFRRIKSGESRFIIANPEVLLTQKMMKVLPELNIVHVVIDEAHCVSEWGESFRPAYLRVSEIIEALRGVPGTGSGFSLPLVTAFTATAGAPVLEKIERYIFGLGGCSSFPVNRIVGNPDRSNIEYAAQGALVRDLAVRDLLFKNGLPAIVFCSSREGTEKLARYLRYWFGEKVRFYHAGLSREERSDTEKWFFENAEIILAATCAFGMGIDRGDIRTVIHRDCPPSAEAYLQESGRAGRDGQKSKAILLWGDEDRFALVRAGSQANKARVEKLLAYARDTSKCRRQALMDLMDYRVPGPYPESPEEGCCDVCSGRASAAYREERSLLEFFRRNKRCYTLPEAVRILAEAKEAGWSEEEAKLAVASLIKAGKLRVKKNFPWKGTIEAAGTFIPAFPS
ncbi:MAG: RecQ family ATP-dependent DNA helicase [Treponema sp.]|nr:RecQ family ATP-dependent DNA helicase [Treponema sp.]